MSTKINTHELSNSASDFERRFQEASEGFRKEAEHAKIRYAETDDSREDEAPGVLDGMSRRGKIISTLALGAVAAGITGWGMGKTTLGEVNGGGAKNVPSMLERAQQEKAKTLQHAKETGEPLISDQQ